MSNIVLLFTVLIPLITISTAELNRSNGYHINRPNSPFTLPIKSNYRVKSQFSLPQRQYGTPIGVETQAPPSPNYGSPNFARNPIPVNGFDLGLQLPTQTTTTSQPEYSNENPNSVESFEDNQNGAEPELGRLINRNKQEQKSAKQEVEPNVTFQFQIPQIQNGFAHALAVYNPASQQQQLLARYQTAPAETILTQPQAQLVSQYQTVPSAAILGQPQQQLATQYQTAPAAAILRQPQQQLVQQYQTAPAAAILSQPAQQQLVQQYQTAPAAAILSQPQQQLVQQYQTAPAGALLAQPQQFLAQYQPIATATSPVTQYQLTTPVVQQQVFGNLHTQAILHPEYYQVQPSFQVAPAVQIAQPIQPSVQVSEVEPITQAVAGQLPTGEPFARATTGKLRAQPTLNQQYRRQHQQILGKLQNAPARQNVEEQNQAQPPKGFAYAAIGF